jgi:hypothetical protein
MLNRVDRSIRDHPHAYETSGKLVRKLDRELLQRPG